MPDVEPEVESNKTPGEASDEAVEVPPETEETPEDVDTDDPAADEPGEILTGLYEMPLVTKDNTTRSCMFFIFL